MELGIASDHGGYELKEKIKANFPEIQWKDYGTFSQESVDYPDIISKLCVGILQNEVNKGIILCGTGIGASITANRFKGIRAALVHNDFTVEMSRKHNNANVLALGGRIIPEKDAFRFIDIYLNTEFEGGRHEKRIQKLDELPPTQ